MGKLLSRDISRLERLVDFFAENKFAVKQLVRHVLRCSMSITNKIYYVWFFSCFLWFWYLVYDKKEKSFWFLLCHFDFKFVAFGFSNNTFHFRSLLRLISQLHFWFLKFDALDFSNDTFDFQNLSHLISQMAVLISKIYRVWFLKWHFWFPKFGAFDFSNDFWFPKFDAFWFLKWHFWFPKLVAFDFSNDTRVWFSKFLDFNY